MAKKNKKKRRSPNERSVPPLPTPTDLRAKKQSKPASTNHQATRETVESLVIALVLAFLFRTFQAEAFVIPTGSMAPTLMGQHKDVYCDQCGQRFKVNASHEGETPAQLDGKIAGFRNSGMSPLQKIQQAQTVAGACQNCRYPMPFRNDLPDSVPEVATGIDYHNSSSGDRILVNKYLYSFTDPRRWDVVVFKYPGDAKQNYIKRLVGLPEETLRIYQGDVYSQVDGGEFAILRKPADKVLAMRQLVHDTDHDPASLYEAGWPLRWQPTDEADEWEVAKKINGKNVRQTYHLGDEKNDRTHWLRYTHTPAPPAAWLAVRERQAKGSSVEGVLSGTDLASPRLVTDFNSYNTEVLRWRLSQARRHGVRPDIEVGADAEGLHWTSDLSFDADLNIESNSGAILLDLVEAGQHFVCEIDVTTGEATLRVLDHETLQTKLTLGAAQTGLRGAGAYRVRFANTDDQLMLWINGRLAAFDNDGCYDAAAAFGAAERLTPQTSETDPGDLSPVGLAARGTRIRINRLQVFRDIYYIADTWRNGDSNPVTDFVLASERFGGPYTVETSGLEGDLADVVRNQRLWPAIADRQKVDFVVGKDQLFVMGDNSPQSSDCRLWASGRGYGKPGGDYLESSLLTGKAVCVYWPHALVSIPTPKRGVRIPIVPNLGDIRLVR